jgi:hypothetical protein
LTRFTVPADADQSLGDLVALAAKDVSQLIRYEIDLAKTELRAGLKRVGTPAGEAAFAGCLVLADAAGPIRALGEARYTTATYGNASHCLASGRGGAARRAPG